MKMHPKSVLITGANRGLGLEFVKQLLQLESPPNHIFAACRNPEAADDLKELVKKTSVVKIIRIDAEDLDTVPVAKAEVEKIVGSSGLNLLINNAGVGHNDGLHVVTPERMLQAYRTNVVSPTIITQVFHPLLKQGAAASGGMGMSVSKGAVINISSMYGSIGSTPPQGLYPYKQSKAALNMTTKLFSFDLKEDGIMSMSICPGWVSTRMGGPTAHLTPEQSIKGILKVLAEASEKDTGTFRSLDGSVVPW